VDSFAFQGCDTWADATAQIGYYARSPGHRWYEVYEYFIEASGRWDPIRHQIGAIPSIVGKQKIQEAAVALGSDVFQREVWVSGDRAEIVVIGRDGRHTNGKIGSQSHLGRGRLMNDGQHALNLT